MFITPLNFPMYSQFSIHNFHFYGSSGLGTSCFHLHSNWQNKSFLRIEGEIIKDDGLNRNLSNCWVIKDTFMYLCWEMLMILLKENINTVRKILPAFRSCGLPIAKLQIYVSASIATRIATIKWREGAIINTFTHFTISTFLPLKVLDCCCPVAFIFTVLYSFLRHEKRGICVNIGASGCTTRL